VSGSLSGEIKAEPNLTPLLDVVFQLITFFMLVINFSNDNYDQRVRLPVAGSARPADPGEGVKDRLVLNMDKDGNLLLNGQTLDPEAAVKEIGIQADLVRLTINTGGKHKKIEPGQDLPTTLVIRSDRDTPFTQVYSLLTACQANGFRKFALKAMTGQ